MKRFEDVGLKDWSGVATSQGMLGNTKNFERQEVDSPLELLEKVQLDFGTFPVSGPRSVK